MKIYEGEPLTLAHEVLSDYALYYPPGCPNPNDHKDLGFNFYIFDRENRRISASKVEDRECAIKAWEEYTERHCTFWNAAHVLYFVDRESGGHTHAVINGRKYTILPNSSNPGPNDGFAGCEFHIIFNDGTEVVTRNLWYQGEIPPGYLPMMEDNAKFKEGTIAHKLRWNE